MLLPVSCPICGLAGSAPCCACAQAIGAPDHVDPPSGIDHLVVAMQYSGNARSLIVALKYRNVRSVVPWLASCIADRLRTELLADRAQVVTWMPASSALHRRRGFDQGRLLAHAVGHELGLRPKRLLRRVGGHKQTGANRSDRLHGPQLVAANTVLLAKGPRVLLIDDVVTTGASIARAAEVLRTAGASGVIAAVAAATPPGQHEQMPSVLPKTLQPQIDKRG